MISNQLEKDIQPDRKMSILDTSKTKTNKNKTKTPWFIKQIWIIKLNAARKNATFTKS